MIVTQSDLSYLIPKLRLQVGDISGERWVDDWLNVALITAFNTLQNWWNNKYKINQLYSGTFILEYKVERNETAKFSQDEPPVIEPNDERAIVLMASIILLEGTLEQSAWDFGSWKDYEISVSNIEGGRILREKLQRLYDELTMLYKPPSRRLSGATRKSLHGFVGNIYEYGDPTNWDK